MVSSYKTIDGRGARVEISNGPCITVENVKHVILHGIYSTHSVRSGAHRIDRKASEGDGITIYASSDLCIDHCYIVRGTDGLIDITHASTAITISNNYFSLQYKVMLLGHSDGNTADKVMKVTLAFNDFGPGLIERMPRVRLIGYVHVANNMYNPWRIYTLGGSAASTILSQGNYFNAPNSSDKEVTKRESSQDWKSWNWKSVNDLFLNGAYFVDGTGSCAPNYTAAQAFAAAPGSSVPALTLDAVFRNRVPNRPCS